MRVESFLDGKVTLHPGDCLDALKDLAPNSIDSIVTDPPYGLEFMGKGWDGADGFRRSLNKADAGRDSVFGRQSKRGPEYRAGSLFQEFMHAVALECFRVLKPGGHLVAFGGTRTSHRMVCGVEDAGFEIRDSILDLIAADIHVVAFLQSLNAVQRDAFARCVDGSSFGGLLAWIYGSGFPKSLDVSKAIDKAAGAERDVVGEKRAGLARKARAGGDMVGESSFEHLRRADITIPATAEAAQWSGFGTALKPACELIVLARKPLVGTVAANVLQHGTGALNIDGCRVDAGDKTPAPVGQYGGSTIGPAGHNGARNGSADNLGRWPANVIHDGSGEVVGAFPGDLTSGKPAGVKAGGQGNAFGHYNGGIPVTGFGDTGSAARFFYTAKADSDDRLGSKHPTVKPLDLMQWLVRLVTPPGGTMLDPFAGTGTTGEAAWREGMRAVLIELEAEYCDDIRRRMALCLAGPQQRKHAIAKQKHGGKPLDEGLFA